HVQMVIRDIQGFLSEEKPEGKPATYRIFHASLQEFLEKEESIEKEWYHYKIAEFYRKSCRDWSTVQETYPLAYLPYHYAKSGSQGYEELCRILDNARFWEAKQRNFRVLQRMLEDVRYGLEAALREDDLPRMVQYGFLYLEMKEQGKREANILALAKAGDYETVLDRSDLYQNETNRFKFLLLVAEIAGERGDGEKVEAIVAKALALPNVSLDKTDRWLALKVVERLIIADRRGGAELLHQIVKGENAKLFGITTEKITELFKNLVSILLEREGGTWIAQNYSRLVKVGESLSSTNEQAEAFVLVARALLKANDPVSAQKLLERALSITEGFRYDSNKSNLCSLIAETSIKLPSRDRTQEVLQRLLQVAEGMEDA
ncbi:MAG: hypothetical protein L0Y56_05965, partial [Nitrospira sp.]|nr:hypothetical protein [Nitrospira sp.]